MATGWLEFLGTCGARATPPATVDFGNPEAEVQSARSGNVVAPLAHLATLGISGADAGVFLQGQLSCDAEGLDPHHGALGCYCTAQGRMLANFLLWRDGDDYRMALAADIVTAVQKRLQMFVLRSKVKIAVLDAEIVLIGVSGAAGAHSLQAAMGAAPSQPMALQSAGGAVAIGLHGERFFVAASAQQAPALWERLTATLTPVGTAAWRWLDIVAGVPLVAGPTQDQFIPQMTNLELIGGINFRKGCYTGQEVIARAQYRGKVKRRMYLAHGAGTEPNAGDRIVSGSDGESAGGTIMNAAPSPDGGYDALVVLQDAAAHGGNLHLRDADGPLLEIRPLPYSFE